jgi:hypothetical protein
MTSGLGKVFSLACTLAMTNVLSAQTPSSTPAPEKPAQPSTPSTGKPLVKKENTMTPQEHLTACAKAYADAKTYRDEGTLTQVLETTQAITSVMPFTTAYERGGRFRWQFQHNAVPGAQPDQKYTIWSADGKVFSSFWTLSKQAKDKQTLMMPLAGATGISGGAATVVVPLLHIDGSTSEWGAGTTSLDSPTDAGTEAIGGVECRKIEGTRSINNAKVTLWIGPDHLIRKVYEVTVVDPAKIPTPRVKGMPNVPKFTVKTSIVITPVVNEKKIEDAKFLPNEK